MRLEKLQRSSRVAKNVHIKIQTLAKLNDSCSDSRNCKILDRKNCQIFLNQQLQKSEIRACTHLFFNYEYKFYFCLNDLK